MSHLEAELLASLPQPAPSNPEPGLTAFPHPQRRVRYPWRNSAERDAWLNAYDPNRSLLPAEFRQVDLEDL